MKNQILKMSFVLGTLFLTAGILTSCSVTTNVKSPDLKMPDFEVPANFDYATLFNTCDKKESDQPVVSSEVLNNKIIIQDEIPSRDLEYVGCDGKVKITEHGPERNLIKFKNIDAPVGLAEPVSYVSFLNYRTCAIHEFDTQETTPATTTSAMDHKGKGTLTVMDSTTKVNMLLNVHDGLNVVKVTYFGKCLEPVAKKDSSVKEDSYMNCKVDKEIGSRYLVIDVRVNRPEVSGKKQIKDCDSK